MSTKFGEVFSAISEPHFNGARKNRITYQKVPGGTLFTDGESGGVVPDNGFIGVKEKVARCLAAEHNAFHYIDGCMQPLAEALGVSTDESQLDMHHDATMARILYLAGQNG